MSTQPFRSPEEYESYYGHPPDNLSDDVERHADQLPQFDIIAWEKQGIELTKHDGDVRWRLGDWLVEGERGLGDIPGDPMTALDMAEGITGLARSTLRDLASTARRVDVSVRTDALTWSHHRVLVNTRPDDDNDKLKEWLDRAVEEKMTVAALAKAAKSPVGPKPTLKKAFLVTVPLDVWETLKDFADEERSTVQEVAAEVLIGHAASDEIVVKREMAKKNTRERRYQKRRKVGLRVARSYNPLRLEQ